MGANRNKGRSFSENEFEGTRDYISQESLCVFERGVCGAGGCKLLLSHIAHSKLDGGMLSEANREFSTAETWTIIIVGQL